LINQIDSNNYLRFANAPACGSLNAFINTVEAQAGKKIAEADALILIAMAEEVLAALGCL